MDVHGTLSSVLIKLTKSNCCKFNVVIDSGVNSSTSSQRLPKYGAINGGECERISVVHGATSV